MISKDVVRKLSSLNIIFGFDLQAIKNAQVQASELNANISEEIITKGLISDPQKLLNLCEFPLALGGVPKEYTATNADAACKPWVCVKDGMLEIFSMDKPHADYCSRTMVGLEHVRDISLNGSWLLIETTQGKMIFEIPSNRIYEKAQDAILQRNP